MGDGLKALFIVALLSLEIQPSSSLSPADIIEFLLKAWEMEKLMSHYIICEDLSEPHIFDYLFKYTYPKALEWLSDQYDRCNGSLRVRVHRCLEKGYIKLIDKCRFGFGTFKGWHFYLTVYRYLPCDETKIKPEDIIYEKV